MIQWKWRQITTTTVFPIDQKSNQSNQKDQTVSRINCLTKSKFHLLIVFNWSEMEKSQDLREKVEAHKILTVRIILEALQLAKNHTMTFPKFICKRSTKRVKNLNKSPSREAFIAFISQPFLLMRFKGKKMKLKMNWLKFINKKLNKTLKLTVKMAKFIGINIKEKNEMKTIQWKLATIDSNKKRS